MVSLTCTRSQDLRSKKHPLILTDWSQSSLKPPNLLLLISLSRFCGRARPLGFGPCSWGMILAFLLSAFLAQRFACCRECLGTNIEKDTLP